MITRFTYYSVACIICLCSISCSDDNHLPPLTETFSKADKNPFGTFVAFQQVQELFYVNEVKIKKTAIEKSLAANTDTASVFISIGRNFFLSQEDQNELLEFADRGNNIFISANNFDSSFFKAIDFTGGYRQSFGFSFLDSMNNTRVQQTPPYSATGESYKYYYAPLVNRFDVIHSENTRILGVNDKGEPNFVLIFYGNGRIYLHCEPRVFSNYFLLQHNNYRYLQYALSFMPAVPEHVFWDDYYNRRNIARSPKGQKDKSTFSVLFKYPPLTWAFFLLAFLLLIYILFGGKRLQRIIKPLPVNVNNTVAFTETVSRLYLQRKDNRNMADKMIGYFMEHIRNQYFLSTANLNEEFITALSRKASVTKEATADLIGTIRTIQQSEAISDGQLLSLNQKIEKFNQYNI